MIASTRQPWTLSFVFNSQPMLSAMQGYLTQGYKGEALALLLSPNQQAQEAKKSTYILIYFST